MPLAQALTGCSQGWSGCRLWGTRLQAHLCGRWLVRAGCWLLAGDRGSFPPGLSSGQLVAWWLAPLRDQGAPTVEATKSYLVTGREPLGPAHTQEQGITHRDHLEAPYHPGSSLLLFKHLGLCYK